MFGSIENKVGIEVLQRYVFSRPSIFVFEERREQKLDQLIVIEVFWVVKVLVVSIALRLRPRNLFH